MLRVQDARSLYRSLLEAWTYGDRLDTDATSQSLIVQSIYKSKAIRQGFDQVLGVCLVKCMEPWRSFFVARRMDESLDDGYFVSEHMYHSMAVYVISVK